MQNDSPTENRSWIEIAMRWLNECCLNTLEPYSDTILHVRQSRNHRRKPPRRPRRATVETFALALCLVACGSGADSAHDGPISGGCPTAEPSPNAPCSPVGIACTYGTSVRPECRSFWLCMANGFAQFSQACDAPPSGLCPSSPASLSGDCANPGAICAFDDGTLCSCSQCHGGPCHTTATWGCVPPPSTAGCTPIAPNEGTACTPESLECDYGDPCFGSGAKAKCSGGVWRWLTPVCPLA